ncbi:MAG TPA: acetate--CoA ligase family protein, partial [Amycolatopsis sp.]|nr:acetate--CoA ligase family protein [Amycolatopsis sp.]
MAGGTTGIDKAAVREILDKVRAEGRDALTAPEGKRICDAYGIPTPREGLATTAEEAATLAGEIGGPVACKIVSPDILHKTEAGGVIVGVEGADDVRAAFDRIIANARAYQASAEITGVQVQQMLAGGQEVIVGATTDPTFGKVVAFGLGGVLVEVLKDVTFRLAPLDVTEAKSMLDGIEAAEMLRGVRGGEAVDADALAEVIHLVSTLVTDFPEIREFDLNPVFATASGACAADVRILVETGEVTEPVRHSREEILRVMNRMMNPRAVAVIGASDQPGKIGNSVMKNLINGGFAGEIHPINPKADEILGRKAYASIGDIPGDVDVAVFAIPAKFVPSALAECGAKGVPAAVLIPSGFAETGNHELQEEIVAIARDHGIRLLGPNIYGYYYTPQQLCATFCTPYDVRGGVAL